MPALRTARRARQEEVEIWRSPWSSTWGLHQFFRRFVLDRNVNKGERSPAESFIFTEDKCQIAAHLGVGERNGCENFGPDVVLYIGAGNEAHAHIGGHEALQQFAGIQFHGEVRLQPSFMKELLDGVPRMSSLGDDQRKLGHVGNGGRLHLSQRMLRRRNHNQLVSMDENHGQAVVGDGKGNDAEVDGIVDDGLENLAVVCPLNVYGDIGILLLEVGKHIRQDVQASALVRPHNDFAPRHALHLCDRHQHRFTGVEGFLDILLKRLARGRERYLATRTVEQLGPDFFLQPSNLRRNRRLCTETLLRRPRKRSVPRHFKKRFELIEVHGKSSQLSAKGTRYLLSAGRGVLAEG